jgi:fumarylacetoacetate (FAA) hydrolase
LKLVSFRSGVGGVRVGRLSDLDWTVAELTAPSMNAWLSGFGLEDSGKVFAWEDVSLCAPVPDPPSVRDFYSYEGHVATGFKLRGASIPPAWYEAPTFYFSNPAAIFGPGEAVRRPTASTRLDFELEIAAVIGSDGGIAGFTLFNDWSARDIQGREMTVGLGPAKGKDFATSIGPWIATPDELPYDGEWLDLEASVLVNGREVTRSRSEPMEFSWPDLVAHAARDTRLRPGDVLASGTLTRGCLLELGPIDGRWIEPGDSVVLEAPGLGELHTPIE